MKISIYVVESSGRFWDLRTNLQMYLLIRISYGDLVTE